MNKLYTFLLIAVLSFAGFIVANAQVGGGISSPTLWRLNGTELSPRMSNWTLGSPSSRIANIYADNTDITSLTLGGVVSGCMTVEGSSTSTICGDGSQSYIGSSLQLRGLLDVNSQDVNDAGNITFQNGAQGGHIRTGTSNADFFEIEAYDLNLGAYREMFTVTASNQPTIIFNTDYTSSDFEVRASTTNASSLFLEGDTGHTGLNTSNPSYQLDVNGNVHTNSFIAISTSTEPATSTQQGRIYFDSNENILKASENGQDYVSLIGSRKINTDLNFITLSSSTVETAVTTFTLQGDRLDGDNVMEIEMNVSNLNLANGDELTMRLYYGNSVMASTTITNGSNENLSNHQGRLNAVIVASSTQQQRGFISVRAGNGEYTPANTRAKSVFTSGNGGLSIDSTLDQEVKVTAQFNAGTTLNSATFNSSFAELIQ